MYRALAAALVLSMIPAIGLAQTGGDSAGGKSAYRMAIDKAELYDKLGDSLLSGSSSMLDTGSSNSEVCPYVRNAIEDWKKAATLYDEAAAAPPSLSDGDRQSRIVLNTARDAAQDKARHGQIFVDANCKAA